MLCDHCGNDVPLGQRTCGHCGASGDAGATARNTESAVFTIVEQTQRVEARPDTWPTPSPAGKEPIVPAGHRTRATPLVVIAVGAGIATVAGSFMLVSTLTSDAPIPQYLGDYGLNDLGGGTTFQVAFLIAGVLLLVGAMIVRQAGSDHSVRFGSGLISGVGLALVPFVAFMWASANAVANRALLQAESIAGAGGGGQVFESQLGVGFFVLIGGGVLGIVAALIASTRGGDDGAEPLNTSLCVTGALACLAAAAGQLIPQNGGRFGDNFTNSFTGASSISSRLAMIAVVAAGGIVGFLLARRFGLGLVLGSVSLYLWQWLTSILEVGDYPAPPALGNPGNLDGKPHIVTTVGVIVIVLTYCALAWSARPARSGFGVGSRE